jgi:hypothetical protein
MISFIKLCCHSLLPAVAQLARYYVYSVYFSWCEILTILTGFFFFAGLCWDLLLGFRRVVISSYSCWFCFILSGCLFSKLMKYLYIARHLAAKFGTLSAVLKW